MRKTVVMMIVLASFFLMVAYVCGATLYGEDGRVIFYSEPSTPDNSLLYVGLVVLLFIGFIGVVAMAHDSGKQQEMYQTALESLDEQLSEKKISEKTYSELRKDLEKKYNKNKG